MPNDKKPTTDQPSESSRGKPAGSGKPAGTSDRPFDKWLRKQLHAMYDEITSEPLPDNLLKLIESDADVSKGPDAKS